MWLFLFLYSIKIIKNAQETDKNIINVGQQIEQLKKKREKLVSSRNSINKKIKWYVKEFLQQLFYEHKYHFTIEQVTIYSRSMIGISGFDKNERYDSLQVKFEQCNIFDLSTLSAKLIDGSYILKVVPKTLQEKYLSEL